MKMGMDREEWERLIHSYIAQALLRAKVAESESVARYWKNIAQHLNQELPHGSGLRWL